MKQVLLVTGGSRGIGAASALLAAQRGYAVCVNFHENEAAARGVVTSIERGGQGGAIVNLSSAAARLGGSGEYVDYAASKGAIDTLTVGLAREVAKEGIRVNAVRPGIIDTEIHASGGDPDRASRAGKGAPLGRAGRVDEVAAAILWLLSLEASYVTGTILDVAGGR